MIPELLHKLVLRESLTSDEMRACVGAIMEGAATPAQIGAFLVALRMKGETVEEVTGAALAMRDHVTPVRAPAGRPLVDTCGTGGDASGTFNISTGAALVAAAAGACVAKHGNRAVSSRAGSADVVEALGVAVDAPLHLVEESLARHDFGFLFAQKLHPALRHAAVPRRELGVRTLFNLLGPLCNPAGATAQVMGVFDAAWVEPLCAVLQNLGARRAMVVHGLDGMDEITLSADTKVAQLEGGRIQVRTLSPEALGLVRVDRQALRGGDAAENAAIIRRLLEGTRGPAREVVLLNAAAALCVAELAGDLREGMERCARAVDGGAALATLDGVRRTVPKEG
jgi:anthranilate phosphoribosyltransferase